MICARDPDATLNILARALAAADPIGLINLCAVVLKPGPTTDKLTALRSLAAIINEDDAVTVLRAAADFFEAASTQSAEANTAEELAPGDAPAVLAPAVERPGASFSTEEAAA